MARIKPSKGIWFEVRNYDFDIEIVADDAAWNLINFLYCLDVFKEELWEHYYTANETIEWSRRWFKVAQSESTESHREN